jgi:hypothetical protein
MLLKKLQNYFRKVPLCPRTVLFFLGTIYFLAIGVDFCEEGYAEGAVELYAW